MPYLDDDFKQWLESLLLKHHVPGISIAVVDIDNVETAGYGFARLPDVPATADTYYCMGSTTKAFTAALMGLVIGKKIKAKSEGINTKLSWSTPISELLPVDFVTTDPYITKNVTIEDALSHRTGIAGHDLFWGPHIASASEIAQSVRHLGPILAPFRGRFQYNNLMYSIVGHVLETITEIEYSDLLKQNVLGPLGMNDTFSGVQTGSKALAENDQLVFARGYYWAGGEVETGSKTNSADSEKASSAGHYITDAYCDLGALGPAGDNISTVKDYAKWVRAILGAAQSGRKEKQCEETAEELSAKTPISYELFQDLTTPRSPILPVESIMIPGMKLPENAHMIPPLYGLGWVLDPYIAPGEQVMAHGGGLPGFAANVVLMPNHNFGLVVAANSGGPAHVVCDAVARELLGKRLGKSEKERRPTSQEEEKGADEKSKSSIGPAAEETVAKDLEAAKVGDPEPVSVPISNYEDSKLDFAGNYNQAAYGKFVVSRGTQSIALHEQQPTIHGNRILRKKRAKDKSSTPFVIEPIPRRGLTYRLVMHNPRLSAKSDTTLIYDLEMLLCHGDLSDDPFHNLKQDFPSEQNENHPLRNEIVWKSQTLDEKGAVVDLGVEGKVQRLGLKLARVDVPDKKEDESEENELKEGWEDRLVWFDRVAERAMP